VLRALARTVGETWLERRAIKYTSKNWCNIMATINYDPNARYDQGQNAAGSNGVLPSAATDAFITAANPEGGGLSTHRSPGLMHDYSLANAEYRAGFSAAGHNRDNVGGNAAGAPRGNGTTATAT